jgi:tetratricopeptide (TPR) repeat protein
MRLPGEDNQRAALSDWAQITDPTRDDRFSHALLLERLGEGDAAITIMAALVAEQPGDERVAERLFYALLAARRFEDARALLKTMPETWGWLQKAGDLATEDGNSAQAPAYYTQALTLLAEAFDLTRDDFAKPIQAGLLAARAQAYATIKQFAEAEADYAAAGAIMPDDHTLPFWRSFALLELGRQDEALAACRAALALASGHHQDSLRSQIALLAGSNPTFAPLTALLSE